MHAMTEDERPNPKPDFFDEVLQVLGRKFRNWARSENYCESVQETMLAPYVVDIVGVEEYFRPDFHVSGKYALWLGLLTAEEALNRDDLNKSEKRLLAKAALDFKADMLTIIASSDDSVKHEAVCAVLSAIHIGLEAGINNKKVRQKITDALVKETHEWLPRSRRERQQRRLSTTL